MASVTTAEKEQLLNDLSKDLLSLEAGVQEGIPKGGFEYIFAIRLPQEAKKKKKEQIAWEAYKTANIGGTSKFQQLIADLSSCQVNEDEKLLTNAETTKSFIECDHTLEGTLNCIIGMLDSFFKSLSNSHKAEFEILRFNSIEINKVFICTRMSPKLAETLADMSEYTVQLSEEGIKKLDITYDDPTGIIPAYVKFDADQKEKGLLKLVDRPDKPGEETVCSQIDRIRLFYDKLTDHIEIWSLIQMLQPLSITMKMFPAHDEQAIKNLQENWATYKILFSWSQNIDAVRAYYGEEIAFYFLFVETLRKGMVVLFVLTCLFWQHWTTLALPYAVVVVVWYNVWLKYWSRLEAFNANKWGSDYTHANASVKELSNPDFEGEDLPSEVNNSIKVLSADPWKRKVGFAISIIVTTVFVLLVLAAVILNRYAIAANWISRAHGNLLVSVQIKVFDQLWANVAPWLSSREEHVTLRTLGQSDALKGFIFLFFNTFNAFFWIAYVSPRFDPSVCAMYAGQGGCREVLHDTVIAAYPLLVFFAGLGLLAPFINIMMKYRKQANDLKAMGKATPPYKICSMEMQTKMLDYGDADVASDFMQIISSIGFVVMFVVVAPVTTLIMAYVAVSVQHCADAFRVTRLYQRPFPNRVANIGIWNPVLKFLNYASIVNLSGLVVTNPWVDVAGWLGIMPTACNTYMNLFLEGNTTNQAEAMAALPPQCSMTTVANVLVFFIVLSVLMIGVAIFNALVPDVGPIVAREKRRQEHQRAKLFDTEETDFTENVELVGKSDWEASNYHGIPQLKEGDPLYVKPIGFGA